MAKRKPKDWFDLGAQTIGNFAGKVRNMGTELAGDAWDIAMPKSLERGALLNRLGWQGDVNEFNRQYRQNVGQDSGQFWRRTAGAIPKMIGQGGSSGSEALNQFRQTWKGDEGWDWRRFEAASSVLPQLMDIEGTQQLSDWQSAAGSIPEQYRSVLGEPDFNLGDYYRPGEEGQLSFDVEGLEKDLGGLQERLRDQFGSPENLKELGTPFIQTLQEAGYTPERLKTLKETLGGAGGGLPGLGERYLSEEGFQKEKLLKDLEGFKQVEASLGQLKETGGLDLLNQTFEDAELGTGQLLDYYTDSETGEIDFEDMNRGIQFWNKASQMVGEDEDLRRKLKETVGLFGELGGIGSLGNSKKWIVRNLDDIFMGEQNGKPYLRDDMLRSALTLGDWGEGLYRKLIKEKDPASWLGLVGAAVGAMGLLKTFLHGFGGRRSTQPPRGYRRAAPPLRQLPATAQRRLTPQQKAYLYGYRD